MHLPCMGCVCAVFAAGAPAQLPDVRLIVLVREPVRRAYSEHQMKIRRVEEQNEALRLLQKEATKIYSCVVQSFPSGVDEITPR